MYDHDDTENSQRNQLRNNGKVQRCWQEESGKSQSACGQYYRRVIQLLKEYFHFTCEICTKDFEKSEIQYLTNCGHSHFCQTCINIYIRIKINTYDEIICPKDGCRASLNSDSPCFKNLPQQLQRRYRKFRMGVQKQHDANFRVCPQEKCEGNIVYKMNCYCCKLCKKQFCLNCLGKVHKGECVSREMAVMQQMLGLRRCPQCRYYIQKNEGCDHMRCRCGFDMCYRCNDTWSSQHKCQRDSSHRIIVKYPKFADETIIDQDKEEKVSLMPGAQSGVVDNVLMFLFILGFIIPCMIALAVVFVIWMALRGIVFVIQVILITLLIVILGIGPFTVEVSQRFKSKWKKVFFWMTFPLTMTLGIQLSLKELLSYTVRPLWKRYIKRGSKLWNYLFVELFQ